MNMFFFYKMAFSLKKRYVPTTLIHFYLFCSVSFAWLLIKITKKIGLTAIAALKKKRKKFSSSKNICPVNESISATTAVDLLSDKVLYIFS